MIHNMELIGHCPVDSGQLLLVDPSYLDEWKGGPFKDSADNDYANACRVTCDPKGPRAGNTFRGLAVVTSTCWGDGNYPVYITRNKEGRIAKVIIDFDNVYGD